MMPMWPRNGSIEVSEQAGKMAGSLSMTVHLLSDELLSGTIL
jgi:hypothetical protein